MADLDVIDGIRRRADRLVSKIDRRLPAGIRCEGPEVLRRARMLLLIRDVLLAAGALMFIVRVAGGFSLSLILQPLVFATLLAFLPALLRRTGSIKVVAHLLVGTFTVLLGMVNLATGGQLTALHFLGLVLPLFAVMLLGVLRSFGWVVLCLAQLVVGLSMRRAGVIPLIEVTPQQVVRGGTIAPVVVLVVVFCLAAWFEWVKNEALNSLTEARDQADRANAAKGQFLSHMSHELRTPMNGVLGALQILRGSWLTEDQGKYVDIGADSARHMLQLLNDILDLSKLDAQRLTLESINLDLDEVARKVTDLLRPLIEAKGVALGYSSDFEAGPNIIGDPLRIRQVMMNLLSNASKFTSEGHVELRVSTRELPQGVAVKIDITDSGIGIPEDKLPQLFEAFTQVDASTTRRFGGTGLGPMPIS